MFFYLSLHLDIIINGLNNTIMKKLFLLCAMATLLVGQSFAQQQQAQIPSSAGSLSPQDFGYFNHLSAGVSLGTDGIGIELAAPITYDFAVRMGYSLMPKFKYSKGLDLGLSDQDKDDMNRGTYKGAFLSPEVDLEGKLNMGDFKLLVDWYPFKSSSFHATAGFFIGRSTVVEVTNKRAFIKQGYDAGIELGDASADVNHGMNRYTLKPFTDGSLKIEAKANAFKPYLGVGFGRVVPKGRIGVQCDFGVQFWGKPEVYGNMEYIDQSSGKAEPRYEKIDKNRIISQNKDYKDLKDAIKTIEKIRVYPVLNIRINGRLF